MTTLKIVEIHMFFTFWPFSFQMFDGFSLSFGASKMFPKCSDKIKVLNVGYPENQIMWMQIWSSALKIGASNNTCLKKNWYLSLEFLQVLRMYHIEYISPRPCPIYIYDNKSVPDDPK